MGGYVVRKEMEGGSRRFPSNAPGYGGFPIYQYATNTWVEVSSGLHLESVTGRFVPPRYMLGSQESWTPVRLEGRMRGWTCSLDPVAKDDLNPIARVRSAMEAADCPLDKASQRANWLHMFENRCLGTQQRIGLDWSGLLVGSKQKGSAR